MTIDNSGLEAIRARINQVDDQLKKLILERLEIVSDVAAYKKAAGLPVTDREREKKVIARLTQGEDADTSLYLKMFYSNIFNLSKLKESADMSADDPSGLVRRFLDACSTLLVFPERPVVGCQGIKGANSGLAAEKLFVEPDIRYYESFGDVLDAVDRGEVRYGVIPIENSIAGSVSGIYEMIAEHGDYIVRALKLRITHALLASPGTALKDIGKVYSHPQALSQCSRFLKECLPDAEIVPCSNTAVAAEKAAENGNGCAAICSPACIGLYRLDRVTGAPDVISDVGDNYTRFVVVSPELEIYPGSDKITVTAELPDRPGALYELISEFAAADINLTKIESRPIPCRQFEYSFIFDFEMSPVQIYTNAVLNDILTRYKARFLGAYCEIE